MKSKNLVHSFQRRLLIILVITVISFHAKAFQNDFEEGYIVKSPNDTIKGYIEIKDHAFNTKNCVFKNTMDASPTIYSPGDLVAYGTTNKKYFRSYSDASLNVSGNKVFLECAFKGKVNLFFYKSQYFIEFDNSIKELVEVKDQVQKDGKSFVIKRPVYRSVLQAAMVDCKDTYQNVSTVALNKKSLIDLFKKYHACAGANFSIDESTSEKPSLRMGLSGSILYSSMKFSSGAAGFSTGHAALDNSSATDVSFVPSIWIELFRPGFSRKFRVRTGINYYSPASYNVINESSSTGLRKEFSLKISRIEVPILLKYFFTRESKGFYVVGGLGIGGILTFDDDLKTYTYPGNSYLSGSTALEPNSIVFQVSGGLGFEMPVGNRSLFIEACGGTTGSVTPTQSPIGADITALMVTAGFPLTRNK